MSNSYIQVPPDGAGKRVLTSEHVISGTTYQIQSNHIVSHENPDNVVEVDDAGALFTRYAEGSPLLAPYGDMKVVQEHIIGVYEHTQDSYDDLFYTEEISGATSTYENQYSSVLMSTAADAGSEVKRLTHRYHYYQHGTSAMIIMAVSCGDSGKVGNTRAWGYADDDYGVLFELYGSELYIEIRGVAQNGYTDRIKIAQHDWNGDKLDGTGSSGIILDVTKQYQYYINISWPFGTVEWGIYSASGGRIKCHESLNDGVFIFPYIKYASLPVYYRNKNSVNTGTGSDLRVVSTVVKSEGEADYTFWRFGDLGNSGQTISGATEVPILSVKPKINLDNGLKNTISSFPETLSVYSESAPIKIRMIWCTDDIFTGDTWSLDSIDGPLLGDYTATEIDSDADSYWNTETFYVSQNVATNIDLERFFELNDEGVLLGGDGVTQSVLCFSAQSLNGVSTNVIMDLSYKGLY